MKTKENLSFTPYASGMDLAPPLRFQANQTETISAPPRASFLNGPQEKGKEEGITCLLRMAARVLKGRGAAIVLTETEGATIQKLQGCEISDERKIIDLCERVCATGEKAVVRETESNEEACLANPLGPEHPKEFTTAIPLFDCCGSSVGALCILGHKEPSQWTDSALWEDLESLAINLLQFRQATPLNQIFKDFASLTSDAILAADHEGKLIFYNGAAERMFGYRASDVVGEHFSDLFPCQVRRHHAKAVIAATKSAAPFVEAEAIHADGSRFPIELSVARLDRFSRKTGFAAIVRDASVRRQLEWERQNAVNLLDTIVMNLPAMLFVKDVQTRQYVFVNPAAEQMIGRPAHAIVGRTDRELFPGQGAAYETRDSEAIARLEPFTFEGEFVRDDGDTVHIRTKRVVIDSADGETQYILGLSEDVSGMRKVEAKVLDLAQNDSLTGLLNRARLTQEMHELVSANASFGFLSIDLDRFKAVNDQFGHLVGDEVLAMVGDRLKQVVGEDDRLARIGGDEFAAIIKGEKFEKSTEQIAKTVIESLSRPFSVGNRKCYLGASIGIVFHPEDGKTTDELRNNADIALYRAKGAGRGTVCIFDAEMDASVRDQRKLEADLREAIANDEISLEFQPVFSTSDWSVVSAEALARWRHPTRGPIPPAHFIPLAEECGLIGDLGGQLIFRACQAAAQWSSNLCVAVNLSPLQFQSGNLMNRVQSALRKTGLPPERLQLEVTESLLIQDVDRTFQQLEALRANGIQVLLDDFGVGYSSLSYFQRFTFDRVKIDRSFVHGISTSQTAKAIVETIIKLGRQLNMGIVAEGVETEDQMRLLSAMGCTHLQGYFLSRPLTSKLVSDASLVDLK